MRTKETSSDQLPVQHLVIGMGEIGQGLAEVLSCNGIDKDNPVVTANVIHICIPYDDQFVESVCDYTKQTKAGLVVIHSTVPVGTTSRCGNIAVHSPIRGKHPHLAKGIRTFVKFFGGERAIEAAQIFSDLGIPVQVTEKSENTEAMKLWDTEIFREAVLLNKRIYQYCKEHDLDFDLVYTQANESYNAGYAALGHPEFVKYVLQYMDGPIGGHCIEPNSKLLHKK